MIVRSRSLRKAFKTQKGIAAILLVLLTGISATVVTFGVMSHVKSSQRSQLAVHGQTQAELNAWASAEALKQFLDGNTLANALLTDYSFSFADGTSFAKANYVASCSDTNSNKYCYQISAKSAQNVASLEVVYHIPIDNITKFKSPTHALIFKGDLNVTGGGFDVDEDSGGIAVDGNLTITSAAKSQIFGCAVGNIHVDGGGVKKDAYLYSHNGDITLTGLDADNLDVWGGNINIIGGGGHFNSIKAVNAVTASGVGNFVTDQTWVDSFTISPRGTFNNATRVNSDLALGNGRPSIFDTLSVGKNIIVYSEHHYPVLNSPSTIQTAGNVKIGSSTGTIVPVSEINNLTRSSETPGVPGRPTCDVDTDKVDVASMLDMANYIFYIDDATGERKLVIQNVKNASNVSVDGTYLIDSYDALRGTAPESSLTLPKFICSWGGSSCLTATSGEYQWYFNGIKTFPKGIVFFAGRGDLSRRVFESANVLFSGFTRDTDSYPLINTILSTGNLDLGNQGGPDGSGKLKAPYFVDASEACSGDFYPSNICEVNTATNDKEFSTIDIDGKTWRKLSLANSAVAVNKAFTVANWKVWGHVVIGSSYENTSAESTIEGTLLVGVNETASTSVGQGGTVIDTSNLTEDQKRVYTGSESETIEGNLGTPSLTWARYR